MSELAFILIFLFSVFLSSVSQILLKKSAVNSGKRILRQYFNLYVLLSYSIFFACTIITMLCYKKISLSLGLVLESAGYIYITILSRLVLKEKLSPQKIAGNLIIVVGVVLFSLAG